MGDVDEPGSCCTLPLNEVFVHFRNIVLLGEAGAGKTTLLRWLAITAAAGRFSLAQAIGIHERLLPVLASIGSTLPPPTLGETLKSFFPFRRKPAAA